MSTPIPINIAVEDELSETVTRELLKQADQEYAIGACFRISGFGYLKKRIDGFNKAAKYTPFFVLTDLDTADCAPELLSKWLSAEQSNNLILRVAVRAVESWLLADREAFSHYIRLKKTKLPHDTDAISDPKATLLQIVESSPNRLIKEAVLPKKGSTARIGPDYNGCLSRFIQNNWNVVDASFHSKSLERAYLSVNEFKVIVP